MNTVCTIARCTRAARWTVTISSHPNGDPAPSNYCTEHAQDRAGLLWVESPAQYTVSVRGPLPIEAGRRATRKSTSMHERIGS